VTEIERIHQAYARRDASGKARVYSPLTPAGLFTFQERERALLTALSGIAGDPSRFAQLRVLDVGCGTGGLLQDLVRYGATPSNLCGVELLESRVREARARYPHIDIRCGNAEGLAFADETFDLVLCFTLFDTIIDPATRARVSSEILRVLVPRGYVLWYDFLWENPKNPDVRKVSRREIAYLFDNCDHRLRRVTLAPPITRLIAPRSWLLASLLGKLPFLCTHYVGIIQKN